MAKGLSLHIGLNLVDSNKYKGEYKPLRNAENDANFYYDLAVSKNYTAKKLIGQNATCNNLIDNLEEYLKLLELGDTLFISYSGHGTRVDDLDGDETDGFDEVLVLYDRLFIDDEFKICWSKFNEGVRIFFINDSCFNGTISRFIEVNQTASDAILPDVILRGIDKSEAEIDLNSNISYFKSIKVANLTNKVVCSIIQIGSCQDNQVADDGASTQNNGKFTYNVRETLLTDNFQGSYKSFFETIKNRMPYWQTPSWDTEAGTKDDSFELSPFLII